MRKIRSAKWLILIVLCFMTLALGCKKKARFVEPDLTPPVLSDVVISGVTDQTATITWNTSENSLVTVEYGTTTAYGSTSVGTAFGVSGSSMLMNLSNATTYHVRTQAKDEDGNISFSDDQTFTTSGPLASITITPASALTMFSEQSQDFTATGKDSAGKPVVLNTTWSLSDTTVGTLTSTSATIVVFTAGDFLRSTTLTATDRGISGTANITVTGGVYPDAPDSGNIYKASGAGSVLLADYDIGINTSGGVTNWLNENAANWTDTHDYMKLAYPGDPLWGAAFILVGPATTVITDRKAFNFSAYSKLSFEIRGELGTEIVKVGIKDVNDPDDGGEIKFTISTITTGWSTVEIPLTTFVDGTRSNPKKLYVVLEFVWDSIGMDSLKAQTIYFKNVKYTN
jgi:hypothetical protein